MNVGGSHGSEYGDTTVSCDNFIPGYMCFPPIVFTNETNSGTPDLG